jgi:hypothetical protein
METINNIKENKERGKITDLNASCCLYSALDSQPATLHRVNNLMAVGAVCALAAFERPIF